MRAVLLMMLVAFAFGCDAKEQVPSKAADPKPATKAAPKTDTPKDDPPEPKLQPTAKDVALTQVMRLEHARVLGDDKVGLPALAKEVNVDVRTLAARAIGRVGDPEGLDVLEGLLKDEAPEVRAEAIFAAALIAATHAKSPETVAKARALVLQGWKGESGGNDGVKQSAAWSLRKVGGKDAEGVSKALGEALGDPALAVRREAMHSFALLVRTAAETPGIKDKALVNSIQLRASDTDPEVSGPALYALMRLKEPAHAIIFKQVVDKMRAEPQRALALRGLTGLKIYAPVQVRAVLLPPPDSTEENPEPEDLRGDPLTQVEALRHIARLGDKDAALILAAFIGDFLPTLSEHGTDLSSPRFHAFLEAARTLPRLANKSRAAELLGNIHQATLDDPGFNKKDAALGELINTGLLRCAAAAGLDRLSGKLDKVLTCTEGLEKAFDKDAKAQIVVNALGGLDIPAPDKAAQLLALYEGSPRGARTLIVDSAMGLIGAEAPEAALAETLSKIAALAVDSDDPIALSLGAKLTGKLKQTDRAEPLRAKLARYKPSQDPKQDLDAVLELIDALVALEDPKGAETIGAWSSNPVPVVRSRARAGLKTLGAEAKAENPPLGPHRDALLKTTPVLVDIHTTRGNISVSLRPDLAPATVASFVKLAGEGFYNGLTFHRVIANFVVQGGDPRGDGSGGPGYTLPAEWSRAPYETGVLGMAHAGKDTGGSQFFITHAGHPHLDGGYTVFGKVTDGMDTVLRIQPGDKIARIVVGGAKAPK